MVRVLETTLGDKCKDLKAELDAIKDQVAALSKKKDKPAAKKKDPLAAPEVQRAMEKQRQFSALYEAILHETGEEQIRRLSEVMASEVPDVTMNEGESKYAYSVRRLSFTATRLHGRTVVNNTIMCSLIAQALTARDEFVRAGNNSADWLYTYEALGLPYTWDFIKHHVVLAKLSIKYPRLRLATTPLTEFRGMYRLLQQRIEEHATYWSVFPVNKVDKEAFEVTNSHEHIVLRSEAVPENLSTEADIAMEEDTNPAPAAPVDASLYTEEEAEEEGTEL